MNTISKIDNSTTSYIKQAFPCIQQNNCNQIFYGTFSGNSASLSSLYVNKGQYLCCDTNDCNTDSGMCYSTQLYLDAARFNISLQNVDNINNLAVRKSCETLISFNVSLKVALSFKASYLNLSSKDSIEFINQFKAFVIK